MLPHSRKMILDETYDMRDTLGEGVLAVVKRAVNKKNGELLAIKIYDKNRMTCYDKECMDTEVELLKSLKHPNIVSVKGCIDTRGKLYLIEELMGGGDLLEAIRKRKVFPEKEARRLFTQILSAIAFLHSNGVVHRDIKPDNMLLSSDSDEAVVVKLADFGFAKRVGSGILHTPCGSPVYTAPEIAREDSYDKSVDVWSAGVLLYILLCGYPPFYHPDPGKLFEEIKKGVYDFPKEQWGSVSANAKDLVCHMLKANPADRITAQQALEHPWIVNASGAESPSSSPSSSPSPSPSTSCTITNSSNLNPNNNNTNNNNNNNSSNSNLNLNVTTTKPESPPVLSTTTTASAADPVLDKKELKEKINKVVEQGPHFTLGPATASPLWLRRHKGANPPCVVMTNQEKEKTSPISKKASGEKTEKSESESERSTTSNDKSEKTDSDHEKGKRKESRKSRRKSRGKGEESEERSETLSFKDEGAFSFSRSSSAGSEESFNLYTEGSM